jgi:ectoine hydroxylase-related dioxygenase (phytanoyl-CoA dioxygenase family)
MAQFAPDIDPAKNEHTGFTWAQFNIQPKKGLLVIFPSWLNHSVPENTTSALRKSLAFNAVPSKTVGSVFSSTKLTF